MSDSIPSIPASSASSSGIAQCTQDAVFVKSEKIPDDTPVVKGEDFSDGANLDAMVKKMLTTGFQATNVALAIEVINKMVSCGYMLSRPLLFI
jgi:deoxyhypusine synthase